MRRFLSLVLAIVPLVVVGGCATDAHDGEDEIPEPLDESSLPLTVIVSEKVDAISQTPWTTLGTGVSYKPIAPAPATGVTDANVLIVYGGYTAADLYVQRWADEIARTKTHMGVTHLYAVRGPNQAGYANKEIQNSKLALHLGGPNGRAAKASSILVIAHSSGTYVASELLSMLRSGHGGVPLTTIENVTLFNLDGGGVSSAATVSLMKNTYFVYACDAKIGHCSHNSSSMIDLGDEYASHGESIKVNAYGSGCSKSSGLWCLHDTLINTRPHVPTMYDLRDDYTDFSTTPQRRLVASYLDVIDPL